MPLITVYFPGPRKAIIDEKHKDYFLTLGAVETQAAAEPEKEKIDLNPDKGSGRPGSLRWHTLHINDLTSKNAVSNYCKQVTGKGCERRYDLKAAKDSALIKIREHLGDDNQ